MAVLKATVKAKISLAWSLLALIHREVKSLTPSQVLALQSQFRNSGWTEEPCRLVSVISCSMLWPLQQCSHRKPFRSRDVICQRLGTKPYLSGGAWNRWALPHQLARVCYNGWRPEEFAVGRNLPVSSVQEDVWTSADVLGLWHWLLSGRAAGWTLRWKLSQQRMWKREFIRGNKIHVSVCLQLCLS